MWLIFLTITCRKCCHFDKQTILTIYRLLSLYIRCHSKNLCNDVNLVSCCHFDNEVILAMSFWAMSTPWCQLEDRRCRNITAFDGYPVFDVESLEPSDLGHFRRVRNFSFLFLFEENFYPISRTYIEISKNFGAWYQNGAIIFPHGMGPKYIRNKNIGKKHKSRIPVGIGAYYQTPFKNR